MVRIPNLSSRHTFGFQDALQGFLLSSDLAFASLLEQQFVRKVFCRHNAYFGGVFHTAIVLWAFMSQVLRDGKEGSCQSAVARITSYLARIGKLAPNSNTGDYCKARAKLSEAALRELSCEVASRTQDNAESCWLWKGRRVYLIDGFTCQMSDTIENQKAYPQHVAQKPGIGFPIARCVGLLSLATGCLMNAAMGPFQGKRTGETTLFKQLFGNLKSGDVVVADRHYCSYWLISYLLKLGVHVCFRKHQTRHTDFRKGKRIGKKDHIIAWSRTVRPDWMSKDEYAMLPQEIRLREIGYTVTAPGRKPQQFIIVTTLVDEAGENHVTCKELSELYGFRWSVELDIRSIKSNMNLGFLRCKSPEMIHREFWTTLLAYNLIRSTIALAATISRVTPRMISFTAACQYVLAGWYDLWDTKSEHLRRTYCRQILTAIANCRVSDRPGRFEPRVVKRRRDQYSLMTEPRSALRMRLANGDNAFE